MQLSMSFFLIHIHHKQLKTIGNKCFSKYLRTLNIYIGMYIILNTIGRNSNCFNSAKDKMTSTSWEIGQIIFKNISIFNLYSSSSTC